jgi:hypothetical protein
MDEKGAAVKILEYTKDVRLVKNLAAADGPVTAQFREKVSR